MGPSSHHKQTLYHGTTSHSSNTDVTSNKNVLSVSLNFFIHHSGIDSQLVGPLGYFSQQYMFHYTVNKNELLLNITFNVCKLNCSYFPMVANKTFGLPILACCIYL